MWRELNGGFKTLGYDQPRLDWMKHILKFHQAFISLDIKEKGFSIFGKKQKTL